MLNRLVFSQQLIKGFMTQASVAPKFVFRPAASFSMMNYYGNDPIVSPDEQPNYYNVYDDEEVYEPVEVAGEDSKEVPQEEVKENKEQGQEVYNSTHDVEIF